MIEFFLVSFRGFSKVCLYSFNIKFSLENDAIVLKLVKVSLLN